MKISRTFFRTFILLSMILSSFSVNAQTALNLQNQTILRVGCEASQSACFIVVSEPVVTANCTVSLISFGATTSPGKNVLDTALTIRAAEQTANLTIDNTGCNGPNPRLIALTIGNPA